MSIHRITMDLEIDDEALADWIPRSAERGGPYTKDVGEWDASDVFRAAEQEIVMPGESEIVRYDGVQPEPTG